VFVQRFKEGTPEYEQYGALIASDSARGATIKGFESDLAKYGEGVDGARLSRKGGGPLPDGAVAALQQGTRGGRAGFAAEREAAIDKALNAYMRAPDVSNSKVVDGTLSFSKKAPMPDWAADRIGMPRRSETPAMHMARQGAAMAPQIAAAQQQTNMEKKAFEMYPQIARYQLEDAKYRDNKRKEFLESYSSGAKNFPNNRAALDIASIAEANNLNYEDVAGIMDRIVANAKGGNNWTKPNVVGGATPYENLMAQLNAVVAERAR
jgi:hypothetical protein